MDPACCARVRPAVLADRCAPARATVGRLLSTALYLIAAEAVTNATRHASGATRVTVDVTASRGEVRLRVHDDGAASAAGSAPAGFGLRGMAERASSLGGALRAGPDPEGGWSVDARLPRTVRAS